ncbi:DNA-binding protein [Streptomyces sp. R302]|uniref:DNA-binding protein n=1 Tax=unclassified Streptomyces TaxID=2593676 RepID=UPI00145E825C|nr:MULTISPECIES: DNA-binding protein [unclassified Streptomyces]NML52581.1 DNA-binding protein [Streptomyces sp. R301]NML80490.1 DNA-binding protein [Streptomyces sp. R302]
MTGTTVTNGRELLNAGAVLPVGTEGAGPSAVDVTARAYRHPVLGEERVVVRLTAAELGAAEDLAAGFLGLEPAGEPVVVGLGRRQELGFPEWVLVHHPEDGHHALAVVPELDRLARQAKSKPKAALDACLELAGRLASSVPHFLPVFYEQAARIFLAVENTTYAGQLFGRARTAEAQHGLPVDEDRLDAVFLEFALAGALPVKVLSGYGKELSARLAPEEAYERFRRLCVRRTAGGLAPSAQATTELRRLARAAGLAGGEAEQDFVAELLPLPATLRAAAGWWKSHRATLVALARRVPAVRGTLLTLTPSSDDGELSELWLDILAESGADAGLVDAGLPAEERCADGAAGWLERYHGARHRGWGRRLTPTALLDLVERATERLRAELAARPEGRRALRIGVEDVNLLDLLLALDVPVAAPDQEGRRQNAALDLMDWHQSERPRDLAALAADSRFHRAFDRGADGFRGGGHDADVMRRLAASAGGRVLLARWTAEVARKSVAAGLPALPNALSTLSWLPSEALALAPDEVAAAAGADLGETLARSLRGGVWEEFHWPEWERAVAELASDPAQLTVAEAWPHLIVSNASEVRVIGADSTLLTHDLRIPSSVASHVRNRGFHYVDGALFVFWSGFSGGPAQGYWHTAPDRLITLDDNVNPWSLRSSEVSLELPGGGRTTGRGVLHAGDTRLPAEAAVISDGTSYWVFENRNGGDESGWVEYDPAEGAYGRRSQPGFLADALRGHAPDARLGAFSSWLRPAPTVEGSAVGAPVDGLLGWRVVRLPGNGWRAEDTAGREVVLPEGATTPVAALLFPGDDRPRALGREWRNLSLTDPDGIVTATAESGRTELFQTAASVLPPLPFLYALRPRDPQGSVALRAADAETAGTLLKAALDAETVQEVAALVTDAFPGVSAPELVAGVVKTVLFATRQQRALDAVAARLHPTAEPVVERVAGPSDRVLAQALNGVVGSGYHRWGSESDVTHRYLEELAAVRADTEAEAVPGRLHFDLPSLPWSGLPFTQLLDRPAAIAYRAVAPGADEEHRATLLGLLATADALGVLSAAGSADRWRRVLLHLAEPHLANAHGQSRNHAHRSVVPLGGGAALGFTEHSDGVADGREFGALLHDPSGRFEVPGPYTGRGSGPVGDPVRGAGWAAAFLKEAEARGAAPFLPAAAEEFGRLTGASRALSGLVLAGMPGIDSHENNFLPLELRTTLGLKVAEAGHARDELRGLPVEVRQEVVAALLPEDPALLWTEGPDVAAAAEVWNARVGRRVPVPDWLTTEAARAVRTGWPVPRALPALLDPAGSPELGTDVAWRIEKDRPEPAAPAEAPFTGAVLTGAVGLLTWLAYRLPAGDPLRAALPGALTAVRERLAAPELLLAVGHYTSLAEFRRVAGTPTETAPDHERYGAVLMATHDGQPLPALRPALLDSTGSDPYLVALRGEDQQPTWVEAALRRCHDPAFARLLADPGAPAAGTADADGTWSPQDPTRSVPGLVAEVAEAYGLGADAAALYLMLLALPDPTDRNTARWTGWKPARLKAARAELAATDLVVSAVRARAGRSLFLPGAWVDQSAPVLPVEQWKLALLGLPAGGRPVLGPLVPAEPVAELYARAWRRIVDGDLPRFEELKVKRTRRRR